MPTRATTRSPRRLPSTSQDYYSPELFVIDEYTNDLLLRGTLPLPPVGFVPVPQLIRATIPISTRPDPQGGYTTGLGDINLFDIFLLKTKGTQLGVGPLVTFPSANEERARHRQVAGRVWFGCFRFYAPLESNLNASWPLPDIEELK